MMVHEKCGAEKAQGNEGAQLTSHATWQQRKRQVVQYKGTMWHRVVMEEATEDTKNGKESRILETAAAADS